MEPQGLIFVLCGLFSIAGAVFDWDWFMNSRKARFFVWIVGRKGARLFYGALGLFLTGLGAAFSLGIIKD